MLTTLTAKERAKLVDRQDYDEMVQVMERKAKAHDRLYDAVIAALPAEWRAAVFAKSAELRDGEEGDE